MRIKIGRTTVIVDTEGCHLCGTLGCDRWQRVRIVPVMIDGVAYSFPLYICERCAHRSAVPFGTKLGLGMTKIHIRNRSHIALMFNFADDGDATYMVLPQETQTLEGDYDTLELRGGDVLPLRLTVQPNFDKTEIDIFVYERKAVAVNGANGKG